MADDGHGAVLAEELGHGGTQTADDVVLLGGDDGTGLLGGGQEQLLIQGLDGVEVQDPGGDALGGEDVGGLQGHLDHHAHGHDGHVLAVTQGDALAQLEVVAGMESVTVSTAERPRRM